MPEVRRAYELVSAVGLTAGATARLLTYEYGTQRTRHSVREALRRHYPDWQRENTPETPHKQGDS